MPPRVKFQKDEIYDSIYHHVNGKAIRHTDVHNLYGYNMTRAAERLFVSQPTMSKQLKELEKELGTKLFVRSNYSIHLTEAGMLLRERAEDILSLVDKTEAEFKSLEGKLLF